MANLITTNAQGPNISATGSIDTGNDYYPPLLDMAIGTNSSGGKRYHAVYTNASLVYYNYSDTLGTTEWTSGNTSKIIARLNDNDVRPRIFISGEMVIICTGGDSNNPGNSGKAAVIKRKDYGTNCFTRSK